MPTTETSTKERMIQVIEEQPEDASYGEIFRELAFARMIDRGLLDVEAGRTVSHEEMRQRIESWVK